jgi:hypothetical protein
MEADVNVDMVANMDVGVAANMEDDVVTDMDDDDPCIYEAISKVVQII